MRSYEATDPDGAHTIVLDSDGGLKAVLTNAMSVGFVC